MASVGAEDGSGRLAYRWLSRNRLSASLEAPAAQLEIGEEKSLRRELSAGSSEGQVPEAGDKEVGGTDRSDG